MSLVSLISANARRLRRNRALARPAMAVADSMLTDHRSDGNDRSTLTNWSSAELVGLLG
jgi:hypothetical protein